MSAYFTPVGELQELTRARGSDVNAREDAVETGFDNVESVISVTSGTITYGTNWADISSQSRLKKTLGSVVILNLSVAASGSVSNVVATLPSGYRPAASISGVMGWYSSTDAGTYAPVFVTIGTNGTVTVSPFIGDLTVLSPASGDQFYLHTSFFTT